MQTIEMKKLYIVVWAGSYAPSGHRSYERACEFIESLRYGENRRNDSFQKHTAHILEVEVQSVMLIPLKESADA